MYVGNLMAGLVTIDMLRQLFSSTMAAAFPDQVEPGAPCGLWGRVQGFWGPERGRMPWEAPCPAGSAGGWHDCGVAQPSTSELTPETRCAALFPCCAITAPAGQDPVVNVSVHTEGRYAFVELRTSEMATAALQLNGQVRWAAAGVGEWRLAGGAG